MIKLEVNNRKFWVKSGLTVLEVCKYAGVNIPRFCYHESLSVAGNCRMCLVEIGGSPKPVVSCAMPAINNMKIFVDTPLVKKARENVLELLLLNHPLDCPICDQGGECDLQDQTKVFGGDSSRFFFNRRGVEDKFCGPVIKTIMTRCIHCTRCVRYGAEIAGIDYFGTLNRGHGTEISNYVQRFYDSEISGNVIDLCPVGALTSKPYAFKARPWELRSVESFDVSDSLGSEVYINFKESEILRVTPKATNSSGLSFITDKSRYLYESTKLNRVMNPYIQDTNTKFLTKKSWSYTINHLANILSSSSDKVISFLLNDNVDLKSFEILKSLSLKYPNRLKIHSTSSKSVLNSNLFLFGMSDRISELSKHNNSQICILFSTNLKLESALLNIKIRLKYMHENLRIFAFSQNRSYNYPVNIFNVGDNNIRNILSGKCVSISKLLLTYKPLIFIGENFFMGCGNQHILKYIKTVNSSSVIFNILENNSSELKRLLNIKKINSSSFDKSDIVILLNSSDKNSIHKLLNDGLLKKYFISISTHGSAYLKKSNVILPVLMSNFEESNIFINLGGVVQQTNKVLSGCGNARSIKDILSFLGLFGTGSPLMEFSLVEEDKAEFLGYDLEPDPGYPGYSRYPRYPRELFDKYDSSQLVYYAFYKYIYEFNKSPLLNNMINFIIYPAFNSQMVGKTCGIPNIEDPYTTCIFSKNSSTLLECSNEKRKNSYNF